MLLIVGLSFCSVTCADTCLIARGMAERSSPTAALNVILSDHDSSDSDWNDGSSGNDEDSSESGSESQESAINTIIIMLLTVTL